MADIATRWDVAGWRGDYALDAPQLAEDDGLHTAVILSLFTDRRANHDDVLPDGTDDRRGWWGDGIADVAGDQFGSRLWLLSREKQLASVVVRARQYAQEALGWLVDDGIASAVNVVAEIVRQGVLGLGITITRAKAAPIRYRFEAFWSNPNAA